MAIDINIPSQVKNYANLAAFPVTGSLKTIFIAEDTNKTYRWTGSAYVEISASASSSWGTITGTLSTQTDLQTSLNAKEPTITSGTTSQYYRGDKSFQTLDKTSVGLGNVDNTTDVNKPVSTATQTALNAKQNTLVSGTNIKTVNSTSLLGSGDVAVQPTLVSGTNIKTINSTSLLGSGDIAISSGLTVGTTAVTSGTDGRVFFQAGGVVQQDANFTYDNTLKRLALKASGTAVTDIPFRIRNSADNADLFIVYGTKAFSLGNSVSSDGFTTYLGTTSGVTQVTASGNGLALTSNFSSTLNATNNTSIQTNGINRLYFDNAGLIGVGNTTPGARLDVRAQGALSTDIAFKVRNSANTLDIIKVKGNGVINMGNLPTSSAGLVAGDIYNNLGILTIV